jgi:CBS domain-containing protein
MNVASILSAKGTSVLTAPPNTRIGEIVGTLKARRIGSIVISSDGIRVEGIVSERDVVHGIAQHGPAVLEREVESVMTRHVITCSPNDSVHDLMIRMTERRIRHLPVVERGCLCGIISIGDVVKFRLEEVQAEAEAMRQYIATG